MIELINWILEEGRESDDLGAILAGVCERLVALGVPLCRASLGIPTIDPTAAGLNFRWSRDGGSISEMLAPDFAQADAFRLSPIRYLLDRDAMAERWKLGDPEVVRKFPLFEELRALGVTEYTLRIVPFSHARTALQGAALSMSTDRPGGFTEADVDRVGLLLPALGVVAYRIGLSRVAVETLGAYLGAQTAARVLQGKIQRGDTEIISAALLLADLRGFTALVDRSRPEDVALWLNQHLECVGDAVAEHGGEILKFLGDGLLAVFPADRVGVERACSEAVSAALDARSRNTALNGRRDARGAPELGLTLAVHFGDVAYGNIGTARRLDFTIIGPAVNEASRMEALGKALGRDLLLSQSVARRCGRAVVSLGAHELRGVSGTREMYIVAP